jgi:hypothetical protein
VSTRYTTLNVLRTIEEILGLHPMNINDGLARPMDDLFDPGQAEWTYQAQAADILRSTRLPIPSVRFAPSETADLTCPGRSSAYWAAAMKGQDFSREDRLDTVRFNSALWAGLGTGPEPTVRDGRNLRYNRAELLNHGLRAPCASD